VSRRGGDLGTDARTTGKPGGWVASSPRRTSGARSISRAHHPPARPVDASLFTRSLIGQNPTNLPKNCEIQQSLAGHPGHHHARVAVDVGDREGADVERTRQEGQLGSSRCGLRALDDRRPARRPADRGYGKRLGGRAHFSWFGRSRRFAKDFENLAETLATFVTLASIQLALRRLARA
jgi:hypothetical protein